MAEENDLMHELMQKVADKLALDLRETLSQAVEREIFKTLSAALLEGEFYRRVSGDLQKGFKEIYQEIKTAKTAGPNAPAPAEDPGELFSRASNQLDAILQTTESATVKIIDTVEHMQDLSAKLSGIVDSLEKGGVTKAERKTLGDINATLGQDLMTVMTTLSFQDLTGQRIKIIIDTIKKIEKIVLDVYMTTGIMMNERNKSPEGADFQQIQARAKDKLSELKGPQQETDQGAVDDLLQSLGL